MPFQRAERPPAVLASVLAGAGLILAVASCSGHITPLNAGPPAMPPARHLGSPIIVQVMRSQPPTAMGGCPVGWVAFLLPPAALQPRPVAGSPVAVPAGPPHPVGSGGASAPPAPHPLHVVATCYRPVGAPVTITSAAVSPVSTFEPPPGQNGPIQYGLTVAVPAADVGAVTAVISQAYNARDAVGITVAGRLWQAPQVASPFPGQQLEISLLSRNQALQLYHLLVPSA